MKPKTNASIFTYFRAGIITAHRYRCTGFWVGVDYAMQNNSLSGAIAFGCGHILYLCGLAAFFGGVLHVAFVYDPEPDKKTMKKVWNTQLNRWMYY